MPSNPPREDPADFISETWASLLVARSLVLAVELGLADLVAEEPRTAAELAAAAGAQADGLHRVLRFLASRGVFAEDEAGRFHLTPRAELLRTGVAGSHRDRLDPAWQDLVWEAYRALPAAVRDGSNAFEKAHGLPLFDYLARHPEAGRAFDLAMARVSAPEDEAIAAAYPFGHCQRIVDIGGGRGGLLRTILARYPRPTGVLFDRPDVVAGLEWPDGSTRERCELVGGHFFEAVPAGGDLYLLKRILHDWDDATAAGILRNVRRAMASSGRLLILEAVIRPGNEPDPAKDLDLGIMALTRGRERSAAEFRQLLARAGFSLDRISAAAPAVMIQIIEAVPAA